jgi:hypothetical protein
MGLPPAFKITVPFSLLFFPWTGPSHPILIDRMEMDPSVTLEIMNDVPAASDILTGKCGRPTSLNHPVSEEILVERSAHEREPPSGFLR